MNSDKWKTKPLTAIELLTAFDKGLTPDDANAVRERFAEWKDFITYMGKLPDINQKKTMYLFFDTETTGLPKNWKAPASDLNNWPRLVQLAWLAYDKEGEEIDGRSHIIKPEGFTIPEQSSKVHGITTEKAISIGESLQVVLNLLHHQISMSEFIIGHNIGFDEKIIGAEFIRNKLPTISPPKKRICTMLASVNFCAIPGNYGNKWPSLNELHTKLFGCGFSGMHDATADIRATALCFWELRKLKVINT